MRQFMTSTTLPAALQWLFFIFANTFVVPLSIGMAFHLSPEIIAVTMRISFILTGSACILQGIVGHRFSLMEGHGGLWWGLMIGLSASAPSVGISYTTLGGGLATGIILSNIVIILLSSFNLVHLVQKLFSPMVMTVYLFLLSIQLTFIFFKGMIKVTENGELDIPVTLFSLFLVFLVIFISMKGKGLVSNFAILIGIFIGWIFYIFLFGANEPAKSAAFSQITLFPLGKPNFEIGIVIAGFIAGLLNLSNSFTSIFAAESLYKKTASKGQTRNSLIITGFYGCLTGLFGLVPFATYTSSIGFLESTRILDRKPFLLAGAFVTVLGIISPFGTFLASMPITVGNAVLFVAYIQMFGTTLKGLKDFEFNSKTIYRVAIPVLIGVCIMNLSPNLFSSFPLSIRPLLSNGLLMGILLSILLDKMVVWSKYE
jgi:xanthine/uracil permease